MEKYGVEIQEKEYCPKCGKQVERSGLCSKCGSEPLERKDEDGSKKDN
jgi:predicted amidophosphoribosyltransferase